jgi:23S rRNA pseudouridine1911/1915/1917 synthase
MRAEVEIAHEDGHFLIAIKPAHLPTTAPHGGDCLTRRLSHIRGALHPTSRLDAEVTGLVTYARTKEAIALLRHARARGTYGRGYLAIASGAPSPSEGSWSWSIAIDPRDAKLRIAVEAGGKGARLRPAHTEYRMREAVSGAAALWLTPHTGRTHQLRVHASRAGVPLLGDMRYGGPKRAVLSDGRVLTARRTMLHCAWLSIPSVEGPKLELSAPAPSDMSELWLRLGGNEIALNARP